MSISALEEAIQPFMKWCEHMEKEFPGIDDNQVIRRFHDQAIRMGDLRAVRAAQLTPDTSIDKINIAKFENFVNIFQRSYGYEVCLEFGGRRFNISAGDDNRHEDKAHAERMKKQFCLALSEISSSEGETIRKMRSAIEAILPFLPIGFASTGGPRDADDSN